MSRDARTVRPFIVGIACFALLAALNQARGFDLWRNYALSGVAMGSVVTWVLWRKDVRIPHYIQWVIVAGLLLHYGGGSLGSPDPFRMGLLGYHGINGAYHVHTWWDNLTHAAGIGAGAMAIAYLAEAYQMRRGLAWPAWAVAGTAFLGALAAGVGVELYEYLGKSVFQTIDQGGYENTMRDLHFNVLGAVLGTAVAVRLDRRRFATRIQQHWGGGATTLQGQAWTARLPAGMAAFLAFAAVPAVTSLVLGMRFLLQGVPDDAAAAYDDALQLLVASAAAGAILGPGLGWAWRRRPRGAPA
jgi:hypothetical protein